MIHCYFLPKTKWVLNEESFAKSTPTFAFCKDIIEENSISTSEKTIHQHP